MPTTDAPKPLGHPMHDEHDKPGTHDRSDGTGKYHNPLE
jgi:hypothetical protein